MSDYVHEDILEKILHRLPPKSIGKCMAVCKSWNLLIKSHRFVSSYQQCSLSSTSLFLVHHSLEHYSICSPNIECWFSLPRILSTYRFVGALNGLVCFATSYDRDGVIIVNPLTRRMLQLPTTQMLDNPSRRFRFRFGFGFDSKNNDFKVIYICYPGPNDDPLVVELYSLNKGVWSVIDASFVEPFYNNWMDEEKQLFFKESVHWLGYDSEDIYYILIFHMVEEKFSKMELPQVLSAMSQRHLDLDITVIDGCLSLIEYLRDGSCNIWMKRESWINIQSVHLSEGNIIKQVLGQDTSSEVLVLPRFSYGEKDSLHLHAYDLMKSQQMRNLGVESTFNRLCASDFTCSLIFLDKESYPYNPFGDMTMDDHPEGRGWIFKWQILIDGGHH
ncbi:F-box/kelch-repeat protein At3g23880-like [Gastrolobium bilobum]|nr:F-box/kelch-repeat protein At3g23880-like [Gastrolobium bilobum]